MITIYVYSNETGRQVDSYTGNDNDDCEGWAIKTYGDVDYHYSYAGVEISNAVNPRTPQ